MPTIVVMALLVWLWIPTADAAQVYRCVDAQGRVEYGDTPCNGQTGGPIAISPNIVSGMDETTVRALNRALDQSIAARLAREAQPRAPIKPAVDVPSVQGTPWWQLPGPPPDRDIKKDDGSNNTTPTPATPAPSPPVAPSARAARNAVPVAPGR